MRFWESVQRAIRQYRCDLCGHLICEGSTYERTVWMPVRGDLKVLRAHLEPGCPSPEEFEPAVVAIEEEYVPFLLAA